MYQTQIPPVVTKTWVDLQFPPAHPPMLQCMQYDAGLRQLEIRLLKQGADWPVPEGWTVNLRMKKADGTSLYQPVDYQGSLVFVTLTGSICAAAGEHSFVLEITGAEQVIQTPVLVLKVWKNPLPHPELTSQPEYTSLQQLAQSAQASAQSAQTSAASAQQTAQALEELLQTQQSQTLTVLSQWEYDALTPPNPQRLYLVQSDHPDRHLAGWFPFQKDLKNQLDPSMTAAATGGEGFGNWDGAGLSYRTAPAGGGALSLTDLVPTSSTSDLQLYPNGYILAPRTQGSTNSYLALPLANPNPLQPGATYRLEMSSKHPANGTAAMCYGGAGWLGLKKPDNTSLSLGIAIHSASTGATGQVEFTAPADIGEYSQLLFYYDNPSYSQYITLTITCTALPTVGENYLTLPSGLFAGIDPSQGISLAVEVKPDRGETASRIFQCAASDSAGELYATQGGAAGAAWGGVTLQPTGSSQALTPGQWHTLVLTVSQSRLCLYADGTLTCSANESGDALSQLLAHLGELTQNHLGYSPQGAADYAGLLKNLRIYAKALSAAEAGLVGTTPSAKLYWGSLLLASSQEEA